MHCIYSALGYGEYLYEQDPSVNCAFYGYRPVFVCRFFRSADYLGLSCKLGYCRSTAFIRSTEQLKPGTVYRNYRKIVIVKNYTVLKAFKYEAFLFTLVFKRLHIILYAFTHKIEHCDKFVKLRVFVRGYLVKLRRDFFVTDIFHTAHSL